MPKPLYWLARQLVPIACVDALPYDPERGCVYLIRREGERRGELGWALVGGGIHRGEPIPDALSRHLDATLIGEGLEWTLPDSGLPVRAAEYFPDPVQGQRPDPRKHAVALTYVVRRRSGRVSGCAGEASDWEPIPLDALPPPEDFVFGQGDVVHAVARSLRATLEPAAGATRL